MALGSAGGVGNLDLEEKFNILFQDQEMLQLMQMSLEESFINNEKRTSAE